MKYTTATALIAIFLACGCAPLTVTSTTVSPNASSTPTSFCTSTTGTNASTSTETIASGENVAQIVTFTGGTVGASFSVPQILIAMSSSALTSATLTVYSYSGTGNPDAGTILQTSTVTTGLGGSSPLDPIVFDFTSLSFTGAANATSGPFYSLVLSSVGTGFTLSTFTTGVTTPLIFDISSIWSAGSTPEQFSMLVTESIPCT